MSRSRSPDRDRALKIWLDSDRQKKPKDIAIEMGISDSVIRKWKSLDKWDSIPITKRKGRGAAKGNNNAKGNKGGTGGPIKNNNAVKHGFFRKFLPDDPAYLEIFDASENLSRLDMLWMSIRIAWTNIIDSPRKMFVTSKEEMIKEIKKRKFEIHDTGTKAEPHYEQMLIEEEYEFQFAWDRQATALTAQSTAMGRLTSMIRNYEAMLREIPPDEVQDEQRLRVEKLKFEVSVLKKDGMPDPVFFEGEVNE